MSHNQILDKIKKRDGSLVDFNKNKIKNAINKAAREVLENDEKACQVAKNITQKVQKKIAEKYSKTDTPSVEDIQDLVEHSLMQESLPRIARAYISYRDEHQKLRESKAILGVKDDLKLPVNTLAVLKKRYLLKDKGGKIRETPDQLFRRVAHHAAAAEKKFDSIHEIKAEETFYHMMRNMEFMPNSPTLMNAGTAFGQLSACFVLPVEDSIDGIFTTLKNMAKIHQTGGETGFDFSHLRAKGVLDNFNISVGATDEFMDAVIKNKKFELTPRTAKK
jgi:ribonucleoside-diphosphate reductase alpha chain